jgi:hypothetical protein
MITNLIENETSMIQFENDEGCEDLILLKLSLSRFVEIFDFFGGSVLKYFDIIVIKKFTFRYFCVFGSSLCPSLNNTVICNFETKSFCQKETKVKTFNSMSFEILKDVIDCDLFLSDFYEGMKGDISIERMISFYSSKSLIELKLFPDLIIGKREIGFIQKDQEKEKEREEAEFSMESENEMNHFREVLQLSGGSFWENSFNVHDVKSNGCFEIDSSVENIESRAFCQWESLTRIIFRSDSHLRKIDGFDHCTSLCRIEIPSSVEVIELYGFFECTSLNEVIFLSESHLKEINGFQQCTSICRIDIPSSVEMINMIGFYECTSLREVSFSIDSHLREIIGFIGCTSLCRIEIPSSVEVIRKTGFLKCTSLHVVTIRAGCRMRGSKGLRNLRSFIVYESDLKDNRRLVHVGV